MIPHGSKFFPKRQAFNEDDDKYFCAWVIFPVLPYTMLHTKFKGHRSSGNSFQNEKPSMRTMINTFVHGLFFLEVCPFP